MLARVLRSTAAWILRAFAVLSAKLQYVNGDYGYQQTFRDLRKALGGASRPLYYLAIPPNMFATVVKGLANADCDKGARVVVEKPFGRDLASAQELNRTLHQILSRNRQFSGSIITSARNQSKICSTSALPTRFWSRSGTATISRAFRSRWLKLSVCRAGESSMKR